MSLWPDVPPDLRPPHAYIPGQTARHPEDWFDEIKASVHADTSPRQLQHTTAFQTGLAYFGAGYFWECHEVLEAVWLQTPAPSPEREMVQALIQLANAHLKHTMGRPKAARRLCDLVDAHLARCGDVPGILGVRIADMGAVVDALRNDIKMHYKAQK